MPTDPYPIFSILPIEGTECIGDSRPKLNTNFNNLSSSANFACMKVAELSGKWANATSYRANATSGYIKLASGIVFQWGKVTGIVGDGGVKVTFPYQGMNAVFNITTSHVIQYPTASVITAPCSIQDNYDTTGFFLFRGGNGAGAVSEMWMAIGG